MAYMEFDQSTTEKDSGFWQKVSGSFKSVMIKLIDVSREVFYKTGNSKGNEFNKVQNV